MLTARKDKQYISSTGEAILS